MFLALDLDGTLLRPDKTIGDEENAWIIDYLEKNNLLAIITSRNYFDMIKCLSHLVDAGNKNMYLAYNEGANIIARGKKLEDMPQLSSKDIKEIIELSRHHTVGYTVFTNSGNLELFNNNLSLINVKIKLFLQGMKTSKILTVSDYQKTVTDNAWKIKFKLKPGRHAYDVYNSILKKLQNFCVTNNEGVIEIMHRNSGKLGALMAICQIENIEIRDVVYIGDEGNDIYCFKHTDSYAMGNAPEWVKQKAKHITSDNNHGGVYEVMKIITKKNSRSRGQLLLNGDENNWI